MPAAHCRGQPIEYKSTTTSSTAAIVNPTAAIPAGAINDTRGEVDSWVHHYRDRNKMADDAANTAMDSRHSQQRDSLSRRPIMQWIEPHLQNDISHWLDNASALVHEIARPRSQRLDIHCLWHVLGSTESNNIWLGTPLTHASPYKFAEQAL